MPKTMLRMLWPYILQYLARRVAEYLDERREQKRQLKQAAVEVAASEGVECPPAQTKLITGGAVWYTLGGVLLGSVLALILANILREDH